MQLPTSRQDPASWIGVRPETHARNPAAGVRRSGGAGGSRWRADTAAGPPGREHGPATFEACDSVTAIRAHADFASEISLHDEGERRKSEV